MKEEPVGVITHFFSKAGVAAIRLDNGSLHVGDTVHIVGHTTDIEETIESMEINQNKIVEAKAGESIGVKVAGRVREHDQVFKVIPE